MLAYIPSPSQGVWHLGPLPLRAYALGIIIGALVAIWIGERRFQARGGRAGVIGDIAIWAIPFGIVGARIYHVITDPELYFGDGRHVGDVFLIWKGGLGIWGAVLGGALGAYIGCRRYGVSFSKVADSLAPGLLVAQAIGRIGNYFNQELFGKPTTLPWGLEIAPDKRPPGYVEFETFHPTFLYELLWNLAAAALIIAIDRRVKLTGGRAFALYAMFYTAGRFWIEQLRIDEANHIGPFRLNVWTSIIVFVLALTYFVATRNRVPKPDPVPETDAVVADEDIDAADESDDVAERTTETSDEPAAGSSDRP
ncbi:prolipoprotein diacylglyceryl transferase [Aeromicrobium fastidiosum]|uniref:Phosphatidylglycerol--prolipoprotein diacylglyceryl transferase n=1 Tax=Aeromicrobium fastidiosum TaxID=52699 RepID=A0A641ANL4_9ACTN|nr:prolipoprotein diacylglyceryl transferase [Aeromicrobium fastidiosum]KAA1378723.1 prolipoprotein diacylglyceryl transferase [Aeromicrobium fastidiosum]MBP2392289.1 prolipoprotein diacylglyceryl transferase [Aeromicrobium fastidiosum]